jgi:hypothetical protein
VSLDAARKCQWCGHTHGDLCPHVKAFEYHESGSLKRVEFFTPNDHVHPELLEAARRIAEGQR